MPFGATTSYNKGNWFESFFEGWLVRQEHYLDELLSAQHHCSESREDDLNDLVARVLSHYQHYYEEKSRAAKLNVFLVFSPAWFTPFEKACFWIGGFKPTLPFGLVDRFVDNLTEEQKQRMDQLMEETKSEERLLAEELARIQESVAEPPLWEGRRRRGRGWLVRDGGRSGDSESVIEALRSPMESVLASADLLRTTTAERVVDVLNPVQKVKFLAAATQLQLRIRMLGLQKGAESQQHTTNGL